MSLFLFGFYLGFASMSFWDLALQAPEFARNTGRPLWLQLVFSVVAALLWPWWVLVDLYLFAVHGDRGGG